MPFASGFLVLEPGHQRDPARSEVKRRLESMGFELYEVGRPDVVVFYVEAPSVEELERVVREAERLEGVLKAYIAYAFLASDEVREWVNRALEAGEVELDETTRRELERIAAALRRLLEGAPG